MPFRKKKFDNPLEAGRYFLQLKTQEGMSVEKISEACEKSVPAVYKYIALAEAPQSVLDAIDEGRIPPTRVIRIIDKHKKQKSKLSLEKMVMNAIEQREANKTIMESQGISKLTVKSRLAAFQDELKHTKTRNAKLLLDFAEKLNQGAPVSELVAMAQPKR